MLGIDLGTSSVKVLLRHPDGRIEKAKADYGEVSPIGWLKAMKAALSALDCSHVGAVGLSSQTGTYIVNGKRVIAWSDPAGNEELPLVRDRFSHAVFLREIGMPHPPMSSYPLPRLLYIKKACAHIESVRQPKDILLSYLTGADRSDPWTWRGLAHPETGAYSACLLRELELDAAWLPPLLPAHSVAGAVTEAAARETGLPAGTPVAVGLNDFFAGLVGMGASVDAPLFDVTGTSEHFGIITSQPPTEADLVSGRFLEGFVHYGGTASSGTSLTFGRTELGEVTGGLPTLLAADPPIFLPYLNGERAPIFDSSAKGVFFGLGGDTTKEQLSYATLEGVAFSIWHIAEHLGQLPPGPVLVGGGAAKDPLLGSIKATLFDREFLTLGESDTSALGAAMIAGIGTGSFESLRDAIAACVQTQTVHYPIREVRKKLLARYEIYKNLYTVLKKQFKAFKEI